MQLSTAVHEVLRRYAQTFHPEEGGEKVFAFDAHRLLKYMCQTWAVIYGTVTTSRKEMFQDKTLLKQEVNKLSDNEDSRLKKLSGELNVCRQKLREVQDALPKGEPQS